MFNRRFFKNIEEGGETKMKRIVTLIALVVMATLTASYVCFAANIVNVVVTATVPSLANGVTAGISRITSVGTDCSNTAGDDTWLGGQSSIAFGNLSWDSVDNIFRAAYYFAIDVGVVDNSGNIWTLTHTRTNFQNFAGTANINNKVNVAFSRVSRAPGATTDTDTPLQKVSYGNSNAIAYTKTQLKEGAIQGWLRIYYGVGTGGYSGPGIVCPDATGVSAIGLDVPAGTYTGQVTLTLTGV